MAARSFDLNLTHEEDSGGAFGHSSSSASISSSKKPKSSEIKKWNAIAFWAWDTAVDKCAICRNHLVELCALFFPCIDCQAYLGSTVADCGVAWGKPSRVVTGWDGIPSNSSQVMESNASLTPLCRARFPSRRSGAGVKSQGQK